MPTRHFAVGAVLAMLALSLAGCQSLREAAGMERIEPDAFAISTKAPLVIPPDFNLRPPAPGAPPTNTLNPAEAAEAAVAGVPSSTQAPGHFSAVEQDLLAQAGAASANNSIRQQIAADNRNMQMADQSFTNQILFGIYGPQNNADKPVNASAEAARLHKITGGAAPLPQDTIYRTKPQNRDEGWFGNLFDGLF
ncbi:MAG: DUF3035 domain-containing protein [Alphaproteobacteria bacterium]|nr:DUF3035 domain-containing protein [Alphaproteobacteria bacterium]